MNTAAPPSRRTSKRGPLPVVATRRSAPARTLSTSAPAAALRSAVRAAAVAGSLVRLRARPARRGSTATSCSRCVSRPLAPRANAGDAARRGADEQRWARFAVRSASLRPHRARHAAARRPGGRPAPPRCRSRRCCPEHRRLRGRAAAAANRGEADRDRADPLRAALVRRRHRAVQLLTMMTTIYDRPEHDDLRRQVARFVAQEVEPNALAWDEAGFMPRDVLADDGRARLARPDGTARVRRRRQPT